MNLTADENLYTVSVVIPAYNIEAYLARALDSVLAQTLKPDEIMVIDDGSTDQTAAVAQRYGSRVRYIHQSNAGPSAARNTGIRAAEGQWVAFLDGDDEWLAEKLELQLALLRRYPHLVWCCANCYMHKEAENRRVAVHPPEQLEPLLAEKPYFDDYLIASARGAVGHQSTMVIKREILLNTGLYREDMSFSEDHDLWWRIAYQWPEIGYLCRPLSVYYQNRSGRLNRNVANPEQVRMFCELLDRHLALSARHDRSEAFRIRLESMLKWYLKEMEREKRYPDLLNLISLYEKYIPIRYKTEMRVQARFPRMMPLLRRIYKQCNQVLLFRYKP